MKPRKSWIAAGVLALTLGTQVQIVSAQVTPPFVEPNSGQATPTNPPNGGAVVATPAQTNQQSQDFINQTTGGGNQNPVDQITGFVRNIPGSLSQIFQTAMGSFKVPDLGQLMSTIMSSSTSQNEGTQTAEAVENRIRGKGSFSIRTDSTNESFRTTSLGAIDQSTLGKPAQDRAVRTQQATQTATEEITSLGNESQNLDVTQHILQNISRQQALAGQVDKVLVDEAQQARADRAIANTLSAQIAEEVAGNNISARRETSAAANGAVQQSGTVTLFGGGTLGSD
jgi:hypothetical protein